MVTSTRDGQREYVKRHNDLATISEVIQTLNHGLNRVIAERIEPLEARIAELEAPWYQRLWRRVKRGTD